MAERESEPDRLVGRIRSLRSDIELHADVEVEVEIRFIPRGQISPEDARAVAEAAEELKRTLSKVTELPRRGDAGDQQPTTSDLADKLARATGRDVRVSTRMILYPGTGD
jgi:hypothetical protein